MDQRQINETMWAAAGDELVGEYRRHPIRPVEELLLERHAAGLSGRVLEIGVGGGRLTERLIAVAVHVTGIDVSAAMVEHCRRSFPAADFRQADLRELSAFGDGAFDAVFAGYNVLDVLGQDERALALDEWRRVLAPGGLLVYSSHNLHHADRIPPPGRILARHPRQLLENLRRRGVRKANRARLQPLLRRESAWGVLNDEAHDYSLLHYYATRDENERQLAAHGFALVECVDLEGRTVGPAEAAAESPELHYVARSASS